VVVGVEDTGKKANGRRLSNMNSRRGASENAGEKGKITYLLKQKKTICGKVISASSRCHDTVTGRRVG